MSTPSPSPVLYFVESKLPVMVPLLVTVALPSELPLLSMLRPEPLTPVMVPPALLVTVIVKPALAVALPVMPWRPEMVAPL